MPLVDNFNAGPPLAKQFIDDELEIFEPEPDDDNIDPVMVALLQLLSKPVVAIRPLPANVDEFVDAKRLDADVCPVVVPVHCISSDDGDDNDVVVAVVGLVEPAELVVVVNVENVDNEDDVDDDIIPVIGCC